MVQDNTSSKTSLQKPISPVDLAFLSTIRKSLANHEWENPETHQVNADEICTLVEAFHRNQEIPYESIKRVLTEHLPKGATIKDLIALLELTRPQQTSAVTR